MKLPKYIIKILDMRARAAEDFISYDYKLTDWMEKKGIDLTDPELEIHILGGCESIVNPRLSSQYLKQYIERRSG